MSQVRVVVIGGGAAGFFAAITCAESFPGSRVWVIEKGPSFLSKVRISGGGRCNVTHACFDPRDLVAHYPRGGNALLGAFHRFQPRDTVSWFESRGVKLKTEPDGRIFPVTNSSGTIIDCLISSARRAGVELQPNRTVEHILPEKLGFRVSIAGGDTITCDRVMIATGGCRGVAAGRLAVELGHKLIAPVPSLFTFHINVPWLRELAGISVETAEVSVAGRGKGERGPVLITHEGLSGPAVLKLSAWNAPLMHGMGYAFPLRLNWLPHYNFDQLVQELNAKRETQPARLVANTPISPIPARLWGALVIAAGVPAGTRWAGLPKTHRHRLLEQLTATELPVSGKSLNQDEFVTCGGIALPEVDFKTMQSRICPGIFFGGELLDLDGLTGGFNFQAAWTTGWIAGKAMAGPTHS